MLTILCVDSELQRLAQLKQDLLPLSVRFKVIEATTQKSAEKLLLQNGQHITLLLCAETLIDGCATSLFQHPQCNQLRKIIYTAKPSVSMLSEFINQGHIDYFLQIPYKVQELLRIVQTQMSSYRINQQKYHHPKYRQLNKTRLLNTLDSSQTPSFQDKFIDYSLYTDSELSNLVLRHLYSVLEEQDDQDVRRTYHANHLLTREGEPNSFLWFICKGEVLIKKRNTQNEMQDLTIMQAGSIVGGMSFLTSEAAFSTSITLSMTKVLKIDKVVFSHIMKSNTAFLAPFSSLLLRNFNRRLQRSISAELTLKETLDSLDAAHSQLVDSEKMAVLGQLVAGIAHELNNPIAAILRGSDTLITLISNLLNDNKHSDFSLLASQMLQQGLTIRPLSTSEVRQRIKNLLPTIRDKKIAKLLVNMNLDNVTIPLENGRDFKNSVLLLNQYFQVGTILRNSNSCSTRIANLVKSLKHYAGQDCETYSATNIHEGLEETLIIFENKLKNYQVIREYQTLPKINCYPIELAQVWTNIIANAIDATSGQGVLKISTINLPYDEIPNIQVIIEDNGSGIPESIKDKIFELNYTTKRKGNFGLGIGLTICSQIIKRHNGYIEIESEYGKFTRFIITLPVFNPNK